LNIYLLIGFVINYFYISLNNNKLLKMTDASVKDINARFRLKAKAY